MIESSIYENESYAVIYDKTLIAEIEYSKMFVQSISQSKSLNNLIARAENNFLDYLLNFWESFITISIGWYLRN